MPQELRTERFWQQNIHADQFWFWDRSLVHDLVSEVESTMRMPFAWAFLSWRWSDAGIYNFWVIKHVANSTAAGLPPLQQLRNLPVEIQRAMPAAHQKCCQCSEYGSISMPNRPTGPNTCHNNNENETCAVAHNLEPSP